MPWVNYLKLLQHGFETEAKRAGCQPITRLEYLSQHIFNFTTYDSELDELFARKAVEVCEAINDRKTFEFIAHADNYRWFVVMCNMPFFSGRLSWGTSIRGAWWDAGQGPTFELDSCGLWDGEDQLTEPLKFDAAQWKTFIAAIVEFAKPDATDGSSFQSQEPARSPQTQ